MVCARLASRDPLTIPVGGRGCFALALAVRTLAAGVPVTDALALAERLVVGDYVDRGADGLPVADRPLLVRPVTFSASEYTRTRLALRPEEPGPIAESSNSRLRKEAAAACFFPDWASRAVRVGTWPATCWRCFFNLRP